MTSDSSLKNVGGGRKDEQKLMSGRAGRLRLVCGVPPRVQLGFPCFPKAVVLLAHPDTQGWAKTTTRVSPPWVSGWAFVNDLGPRVEVNRSAAPHQSIRLFDDPNGA